MSIKRNKLHPLVLTILGLSASPILCSILPISKNAENHFKSFSQNLLVHSDLDEFSVEKGAAISSPFGVGYMLANINERVWNVSNEGVDQVLKTTKVAEDYEALIQRMEKAGISISSTLFTRDPNVSQKVPEGSRRMKTETRLVDFIDDWKATWLAMNARVANQTEGALDDQLIPKGGWWGGAFYYFTMGAFINTNHYKGAWEKNWTEIGPKKFYDGHAVPFFETEGNFPYMDSQNYSAVSIKLKDSRKSVVFVLPKVPLVPFLLSDMAELVRSEIPTGWEAGKTRKVQLPEINITLLDQHYKKLEALGLNYTFCVDEPDSQEVASRKGPFFMGPIVQSHHVTFSPKYFRVASATGSSLNSEELMRTQGVYHVPPTEAEEPSDGEEPQSEFVLPMEMDEKLIKALATGDLELKQVDLIVENEDKKNETLSGSASSVEAVSVSPDANQNQKKGKLEIAGKDENVSTSTSLAPESTTQPSSVPEALPEGTLRFDRPFFWYLWDSEMGPLYYGAIHSLATYQKEYGIETEEDLWLYDAYKTLLWNCP